MFRVLSGLGLLLLLWFWWERPAETAASGVLLAGAVPGQADLQGTARIVDGDTFVLRGVTIRLQGVDAPEARERCLDARGQSFACGTWATAQTRQLIDGRPLTCRDLGERTHERVVAQCHVGGQDLGALLIARGIVRACPRYARRHPHSRGYEAIEAQAIAQRIGLHAGQTPARAGFCDPAPGAAPPAVADDRAAAPGGCAIKGNINRAGERIYHMPGQRDYARTRIDTTRGERWFCSEAEARAADWRPARR